jgi:hypothetical protein
VIKVVPIIEFSGPEAIRLRGTLEFLCDTAIGFDGAALTEPLSITIGFTANVVSGQVLSNCVG